MPTDDVQDLFDTGGDDESEDAAEQADDESEDSVAWDELESIDDDESGADSARTDPDAPSMASDGVDEEAEASSMDWSTAADEPREAETDERDTPPSGTTDRESGRSDDPEVAVDRPSADAPGDRDAGTGSSPTVRETTTAADAAGGTEGSTTTPDDGADDDGFDVGVSSPDTDATEPPSADGSFEDTADASAPDPDATQTASPDSAPAEAATSTADRDGRRGSAATDPEATESPPATTAGSSRLPTGIDPLDRVMGGGVPPGRLVLLVADPGVQSELLVDSVLAQRDTLFVSTDRPDWEVSKDIEPGLGSGEIKVRDHTPDSLLSGVDTLLDELGTTSNFVLDSVNELELVPRPRYRIFLSDVKQRLFDTGSIGLLTGVTVDHESARDLTLRRADIVWRLETRTVDDRIENRLSVPKFRGGAAVSETVKLELTDEVKVDSSWEEG